MRELGFSVVIDMRGNSSWSTVKPILKVYLVTLIIIMINIRIIIMINILITIMVIFMVIFIVNILIILNYDFTASILVEQKYFHPWVLEFLSDKHPLVSFSLPSIPIQLQLHISIQALNSNIEFKQQSHHNHVSNPQLQVLQDHFGNAIHTAHIIKPDNFWQKQRTNLGSQKYKFEVSFQISWLVGSANSTPQKQQ